MGRIRSGGRPTLVVLRFGQLRALCVGDAWSPRLAHVREPDHLRVERADSPLSFGARLVQLTEPHRCIATDDDWSPAHAMGRTVPRRSTSRRAGNAPPHPYCRHAAAVTVRSAPGTPVSRATIPWRDAVRPGSWARRRRLPGNLRRPRRRDDVRRGDGHPLVLCDAGVRVTARTSQRGTRLKTGSHQARGRVGAGQSLPGSSSSTGRQTATAGSVRAPRRHGRRRPAP